MTASDVKDSHSLPAFCHKLPPDLLVLYYLLPKVGVRERKPLLTLCRVQSQVEHNTRLMCEIRPFLSNIYRCPTGGPGMKIPKVTTYFDLCSTVSKYRDDPIAISFCSSIIRSLPYEDPESASLARQEGIDKELHAASKLERGFSVNNYFSIFPPDDSDGSELHTPWNRQCPPRPFLNLKIRRRLASFLETVSDSVYLPRFQANKTVSRSSARDYLMCTKGEVFQEDDGSVDYTVTSGDLLDHYRKTGHKIGGPCEVRVAWKYNDLKPRVYYAQGGDAFFSSLYIQQIANKLVRLFSSTHTKTRYSLIRLVPQDPLANYRHFMLHDYASFTSQMEEVRYFLKDLSSICKGTEITVIDVKDGVQQVNLGEYLDQYIRHNLEHPLYSLERLTGDPEDILAHQRAGMLGVYGNIALCTFLHGLYLMQISGGEESSTTVGDDGAHFVDAEMTPQDSINALQEIGEINNERFIIFENIEVGIPRDQSWHFIKRPVRLIDGFIDVGILLEFPLIVSVFSIGDPSHTVSFGTLQDRRRNFCMQTGRFLSALPKIRHLISDSDFTLLLDIFKCCYNKLSFPISGSLPPHPPKSPLCDFHYAVPPLIPQVLEMDWLDYLMGDCEQSTLEFPKVLGDLDPKPQWSLMSEPEGEFYEMEMKPGMTLLEYFGFISCKMIVEEQIRSPYVDSLYKDFVRGARKPLYSVWLLSRPPAWFSVVETFVWRA